MNTSGFVSQARSRRILPPSGSLRYYTDFAWSGLLHAGQSMLILTCIALFFITFTFQPFRIPSASMEPTLLVGDFLLVDKQSTDLAGSFFLPPTVLHNGDIVVFHDPVDPNLHLVKRVIGLPGDRIRLRSGRVLVNGTGISEPYAVYRRSRLDVYRDSFPDAPSPDSEVDAHWWIRMHTLVDHGDLLVPPDSFFVLGDNRNDSVDSRYWGLVPRASIVGKPLLIYLSLRLTNSDPASESGPTLNALSPSDAGLTASFRFHNLARWERTLTIVR